MEALWYAIVSGMLAVYAVLDGFDLGVGIVHRLVGPLLVVAQDSCEVTAGGEAQNADALGVDAPLIGPVPDHSQNCEISVLKFTMI